MLLFASISMIYMAFFLYDFYLYLVKNHFITCTNFKQFDKSDFSALSTPISFLIIVAVCLGYIVYLKLNTTGSAEKACVYLGVIIYDMPCY